MKKYLIIIASLLLVFASCKSKKTTAVNKDEYYTCSMHPQIMEDKPGN